MTLRHWVIGPYEVVPSVLTRMLVDQFLIKLLNAIKQRILGGGGSGGGGGGGGALCREHNYSLFSDQSTFHMRWTVSRYRA
jgi:hypothetical protein